MLNWKYAFIILFIVSLNAYGQEVFSAGGGFSSDDSWHISFVIGQMAIVEDQHLSSGLLNVFEESDVVLEVNNQSTELEVYPNPVEQKLRIDFHNEYQGLHYKLFDLKGKELAKGALSQGNMLIDVSYLDPNLYQLMILDNEVLMKVFKVLKK